VALPQHRQSIASSHRGTALNQFQSFIKSLPNAGKGEQIADDILDSQVYSTILSDTEAAEVRKNPIVQFVVRNNLVSNDAYGTDDDSYSPVPAERKPILPNLNANINRVRPVASPKHLSLISQGPRAESRN
jgi:hypothetical protein